MEVFLIKQVYIASPLRGDYNTNIQNAVEYCRLAAEHGILALAPHIIFSQWCNDAVPEQREQGLKLGLELLTHCEELWVMGTQISEGMEGEIEFAADHNIPTFYVSTPLFPQYYPISPDGNCLICENDCIPGSRGENYEDKMVVLRHESLGEKYRTPVNQLWFCTHGPGCDPSEKFSDTVHLTHPIDRDLMAVGRFELLGVAKPETLERLSALYPKLEENLLDWQAKQSADEDLGL